MEIKCFFATYHFIITELYKNDTTSTFNLKLFFSFVLKSPNAITNSVLESFDLLPTKNWYEFKLYVIHIHVHISEELRNTVLIFKSNIWFCHSFLVQSFRSINSI